MGRTRETQDWYLDIWDLHEAIDAHRDSIPRIPSDKVRDLRLELIKEEINETLMALHAGDIPEIADGITDSIVVLLGTAVSYGIDIRPIWDEVHKTNMAKSTGPIREDGKRLKPEGWVPPNVEGILRVQGYIKRYTKAK